MITSLTPPSRIVFAAVVFASALRLGAHSPFTPEPGKFNATASYSHQSFDEFHAGSTKVQLPDDIVRQQFRVFTDYGLTERSAFDLSLGYADVRFDPANQRQRRLADSYVGYRYRFADEATAGVAASVRVGATIPGNYDVGQLSAPGDDAFGADLSVTASRHLVGIFRGNATAAYFVNEGAVPESWALKFETVASLPKNFFLDTSLRVFSGVDGLDIGGPGFNGLQDLPKVRERGQIIEVGAAYVDAGGRYYRLYFSKCINGRNVGAEQTFGGSVTLRF